MFSQVNDIIRVENIQELDKYTTIESYTRAKITLFSVIFSKMRKIPVFIILHKRGVLFIFMNTPFCILINFDHFSILIYNEKSLNDTNKLSITTLNLHNYFHLFYPF